MDNLKIEKSDCTCNSDCCQPTKRKLWKKILFVAILFLAVAIVSVKLVGKSITNAQIKTNSISAKQSSCCDTTDIKGNVGITNPEKNKSCCQPTKK